MCLYLLCIFGSYESIMYPEENFKADFTGIEIFVLHRSIVILAIEENLASDTQHSSFSLCFGVTPGGS